MKRNFKFLLFILLLYILIGLTFVSALLKGLRNYFVIFREPSPDDHRSTDPWLNIAHFTNYHYHYHYYCPRVFWF